ncbi:translation initiation factor IF-2-like [Oryza brachyantha]|uniref:translation initiation factor IF-2-like n=1 Tax=Oryza brachyantha TaxID=4533 RepID=UPI001ADAC7D2|nr:translation initiation factor IF-2-like [Oryza brachyantha]
MASQGGGVREAAEILVSFRNRELVRWPEWIPRPSKEEDEEVEEEEEEEEGQVKWLCRRPRSQRPLHRQAAAVASARASGRSPWLAGEGSSGSGGVGDAQATLPPPARERIRVRVKVKTARTATECSGAGAGSGVNFSREGVASSQPRAAVRPMVKAEPTSAARTPESPPFFVTAAAGAGSVPSTSWGGDRERPRPRPLPTEKAPVKTVPAAVKEAKAMDASSPDTPLEYAAAAGSRTSSSGDDAAQSAGKRKSPGAGGSSGDEGCSLPEKRAHLDAIGGGAQTTADKEERSKFADDMNRNEEGVLMFDLNECLDEQHWS